ncbi:MAG: DUF2062 domain-containing protein [Bacteroidota bacterium]
MKVSLRDWFNHKLVYPIISFLNNGTSARGIALALALSVVLGLFPIPGSTTILCFLVAIIGNYNIAVMQLINYLIYPIQLLLIIPLMALGSTLLGLDMSLFTVSGIIDLFQEDFWQALNSLWRFQLAGVIAWSIFVLPVSVPLYYLCRVLIDRFSS